MRIVLALLCWLAAMTMAAGTPPTTTSVVNDMIDRSVASIISSVGKGQSIRVTVDHHPDANWIRSVAIAKASELSDPMASNHTVGVHIVIRDLSTRYEAMDDADSIRRIITCNMSAIIEDASSQRSFAPAALVDTVTCLRADALQQESRQHAATHGEMPAIPSTFWDDVLEPAIFVAAAVVSVVLLFTVRSQ